MNALTPGTFKDDQNNVLQLFRVRVYDCGPDGMHGNADDRIFASQGIFVP
jgi:hypothetical protein